MPLSDPLPPSLPGIAAPRAAPAAPCPVPHPEHRNPRSPPLPDFPAARVPARACPEKGAGEESSTSRAAGPRGLSCSSARPRAVLSRPLAAPGSRRPREHWGRPGRRGEPRAPVRPEGRGLGGACGAGSPRAQLKGSDAERREAPLGRRSGWPRWGGPRGAGGRGREVRAGGAEVSGRGRRNVGGAVGRGNDALGQQRLGGATEWDLGAPSCHGEQSAAGVG